MRGTQDCGGHITCQLWLNLLWSFRASHKIGGHITCQLWLNLLWSFSYPLPRQRPCAEYKSTGIETNFVKNPRPHAQCIPFGGNACQQHLQFYTQHIFKHNVGISTPCSPSIQCLLAQYVSPIHLLAQLFVSSQHHNNFATRSCAHFAYFPCLLRAFFQHHTNPIATHFLFFACIGSLMLLSRWVIPSHLRNTTARPG